MDFEVGDDIIPEEFFVLKHRKGGTTLVQAKAAENTEENCDYSIKRNEFPEEERASGCGKVPEVSSDDMAAIIARLDAAIENTRNTNEMLQVIVENTSDANALLGKFMKKAPKGRKSQVAKRQKNDAESM